MKRKCKDCDTVECILNYPRCKPCQKKFNAVRAAKVRARAREELLKQNSKLLKHGKRVCGVCRRLLWVTEFATSMGNRKGKINKICDKCLCRLYISAGKNVKGFTYRFWRARAYALNSRARHKMKLELCRRVSTAELSYIFKPQDLMKIFEEQSGKCAYCRVVLTTENLSCDHNTPISRGGEQSAKNICLTCADCNTLKHTRTGKEFKKFIVMYAKRFIK